MSEPFDKKLYEKVKKMATKKFTSKTGIYRSSWIVKKYKELGGKYKGKKSTTGLKRWFKEDWVDLNRPIIKNNKIVGYQKCGRKSVDKAVYPLCRPNKRISSKTPRTIKEISKKSISKAKKDKAKVRNKKNIQFGGEKEEKKQESSIVGIISVISATLLSIIFFS
jgi:hypothetical protein